MKSWNSFACCSVGQADACIRDCQIDPVASIRHLAHSQRDLAGIGELAGIAQQIEQDLLEPHGVCGQRSEVLLGFHHEAVLVLLGELSRCADHLIDQPGQVDWFRVSSSFPASILERSNTSLMSPSR